MSDLKEPLDYVAARRELYNLYATLPRPPRERLMHDVITNWLRKMSGNRIRSDRIPLPSPPSDFQVFKSCMGKLRHYSKTVETDIAASSPSDPENYIRTMANILAPLVAAQVGTTADKLMAGLEIKTGDMGDILKGGREYLDDVFREYESEHAARGAYVPLREWLNYKMGMLTLNIQRKIAAPQRIYEGTYRNRPHNRFLIQPLIFRKPLEDQVHLIAHELAHRGTNILHPLFVHEKEMGLYKIEINWRGLDWREWVSTPRHTELKAFEEAHATMVQRDIERKMFSRPPAMAGKVLPHYLTGAQNLETYTSEEIRRFYENPESIMAQLPHKNPKK